MPKKAADKSLATPEYILKLLQENPEGLTRTELRRRCDSTEGKEQFGPRIRGVRELGWKVHVRYVDKSERLYILGDAVAKAADDGVNEKSRAAGRFGLGARTPSKGCGRLRRSKRRQSNMRFMGVTYLVLIVPASRRLVSPSAAAASKRSLNVFKSR